MTSEEIEELLTIGRRQGANEIIIDLMSHGANKLILADALDRFKDRNKLEGE